MFVSKRTANTILKTGMQTGTSFFFTVYWLCATKQTPFIFTDVNALFFSPLHSRSLFPAFTIKTQPLRIVESARNSTKLNQFAICVCITENTVYVKTLSGKRVVYFWGINSSVGFLLLFVLTGGDRVIILLAVRLVNDTVSATFVTLHPPCYNQRCPFEASSSSSSSQIHRVFMQPEILAPRTQEPSTVLS